MGHPCWRWFIFFLVTAELFAKSQVDGYVAGAPPESCDTMLPIHSGSGFDDCSVANLCPTVTIVGVDIVNSMFEYNCSQNYTIEMNGGASSLRGFLVEFRKFSNSSTFDGNLSHVGEFGIQSGYEDSTRLECEGHGVTQSKINTAGMTSFVWMSPGIGQQEKFQMWYTIVTSPSAYFRPRKDVVGVPSEVSCTCPENTYLVVVQSSPQYKTECVDCPANSTSERGIGKICPCIEGFGRIEESNASSPCVDCFTGRPGSINIISSQRPNVIISWTAPTDSERWSVLYRVTVTSNFSIEVSRMTMVVLPDLTPLTNYTLSVFAYTESGCLSDPTSVNITVMERCPDTPPNITSVVTLPEVVQLQYTHPQTSDPMISQSDFRYALYRKCSSDSIFKLVENGIRDTVYSILNLPPKTSCTVRLVAYSNDCPFMFRGRFSVDRSFTTTASTPLPTTPQLTGGEGNVVIRIIPEPGIPLYRCIYRMGGSMNITERNASDVDNWMVDLPPGTYTVQCAGVNEDGFLGMFSSPQTVIVEPPTPEGDPPEAGVIVAIVLASLVVVGGVVIITIAIVVAFSVSQRRGKQFAVNVTYKTNPEHTYDEVFANPFSDSTHSGRDKLIIIAQSDPSVATSTVHSTSEQTTMIPNKYVPLYTNLTQQSGVDNQDDKDVDDKQDDKDVDDKQDDKDVDDKQDDDTPDDSKDGKGDIVDREDDKVNGDDKQDDRQDGDDKQDDRQDGDDKQDDRLDVDDKQDDKHDDKQGGDVPDDSKDRNGDYVDRKDDKVNVDEKQDDKRDADDKQDSERDDRPDGRELEVVDL